MRDRPIVQEPGEPDRVPEVVLWFHAQCRAGQEGRPDVGHGGIERRAQHPEGPGPGRESERGNLGVEEVDEPAVFDQDALGPAGRTGRVNRIRQPVRPVLGWSDLAIRGSVRVDYTDADPAQPDRPAAGRDRE